MQFDVKTLFDSKFSISPDVLFQEIDGETVLLDLASESYFGLDKTATRIWQLLQEANGLSEIHRILLEEFDVEAEQLKTDMVTHLQELLAAGLVTTVDSDSV